MSRWPRVLVLAEGDELARSLHPIAEAFRWIVEVYRRISAVQAAIQQLDIGVILIELTPGNESELIGKLIASCRANNPDLGIVVVANGKIPEAQRPDWIANWMNLGVSYVVFPPLTETVTLDLLTGLITAQQQARQLKGLPGGQAIDLAEEGLAEE